MAAHVLLLLSFWIFSILILSSASDTIQASESIEPSHTEVSTGEVFELGFFTPSNSMKQYVGLWYKVSKSTIVTQDGDLNRYIWNEGAKAWNLYVTYQTDNCDKYALCGAYAACNINNSPSCGCLRGFVPKSQEDWSAADWSSGCVRRTPLNCSSGDGFVKHTGLKVPDTQNATSNISILFEECSCTAYANSGIRDGGSGCWQWFGELVDIREYTEIGQAIFIRLASSAIGQAESSS